MVYFHRVDCECGVDDRFGSLTRDLRRSVFLDAPYRMLADKKWHLQGNSNAPDQNVFLDQNPDVVLLVYKNYRCKDDSELYSRPGTLQYHLPPQEKNTPSPGSESMVINSTNLAEALSWATSENDALGSRREIPALRTEIRAPYHQLYYNQPPLRQQLSRMDEDHQRQLSLAIEYIEESFENSHGEAKSLFSQGLVSRATLPIFSPLNLMLFIRRQAASLFIERKVG